MILGERVLLYWMDGSDEPGKAMKSSEINLSSNKKQPCEITHVTISDPHILIYTRLSILQSLLHLKKSSPILGGATITRRD